MESNETSNAIYKAIGYFECDKMFGGERTCWTYHKFTDLHDFIYLFIYLFVLFVNIFNVSNNCNRYIGSSFVITNIG